MKEKFAGPANKTPESDSGVFPVNNLYVEPLDWGDFGDINGNKKYQRASPAEQKPRNPFLERKDYADQVVKELEKEISPTERIDALAQKKRQLGEQVTLSKQSYTQFLSETNKQLDSLEKVVGLLTANDSSKSVALLDDAKMAITELQRELNERQKEQEILLANRAEEIAAIDTEIQAFGVDPEKLSTKTLLAIEKENNEELKMLRRNLSLIAAFEPNYESIIEPLIRTIETTLGANVYFRFFDEDWFKLGFDPSGKLNQASINETLKRFHVLCRTVDRDLVTPYTEDLLSFDGVDLSNFSGDLSPKRSSIMDKPGFFDKTYFIPDGSKHTTVKDRKYIAERLINDYQLMKKKLNSYRHVIEARIAKIEQKQKNSST